MLKRYFLGGPTNHISNTLMFYYNTDSSDKNEAVCAPLVIQAVGQRCRLIMAVVSDVPLRRPAHFIIAGWDGPHDLSYPLLAHSGPAMPKHLDGTFWLMSAVRRRLEVDFNNARPLYVRLVPIVK